jgi:hypothetical protein
MGSRNNVAVAQSKTGGSGTLRSKLQAQFRAYTFCLNTLRVIIAINLLSLGRLSRAFFVAVWWLSTAVPSQ